LTGNINNITGIRKYNGWC